MVYNKQAATITVSTGSRTRSPYGRLSFVNKQSQLKWGSPVMVYNKQAATITVSAGSRTRSPYGRLLFVNKQSQLK